MREPNFSESQLQQAVNAVLIRFIAEQTGTYPFAHVPSLFDERDLGWDTGFYFHWIENSMCFPNPDQQGCNFFIQYKLSGLLTSSGAKEWPYWGEEYFRFKIPHVKKNSLGKYIDDYHQWDSLRGLADQGYPTFYATNSTLSKEELIEAYNSQMLVHEIPLLDVRSINNLHKHVTFTSNSREFKLHSEIEAIEKTNFGVMVEELSSRESKSILETTNSLELYLREKFRQNESFQHHYSYLQGAIEHDTPSSFLVWRKYLALTSLVKIYIGADMMWIPK